MTLSQAITKVRELSRTNSSGASDTAIMQLINEGQREFAKDAYGMITEDYLTITPLFDLQTDFAFSLALNGGTATDVAITTMDYINATAGTVATQLTTALTAQAATCTISWASASWYFTLTFEATVSSAVFAEPTAPTHIDALNLILGGAASFTAPTCTGSFPLDCAVEVSLPDNFLQMYRVEWDDNALSPAPFGLFVSPEYTGTPIQYHVYGKRLRLYPAPGSQKSLHIFYKYYPTDWVDAATQGSVDMTIDTEHQLMPLYFAASLQAEMNFEELRAQRLYSRYLDQVRKYNRLYNNQNPAMFPRHEPVLVPKVTFSSED